MMIRRKILLQEEDIIGTFGNFIGNSGHGLEFRADIILPYQREFQCMPMRGRFVLIQLDTPYEAILGRIVSPSKYRNFSVYDKEYRWIPEQDRERFVGAPYGRGLLCRISIHVLGVLTIHQNNKITFVSSHRRFPRPGSCVAFPSIDVLREIAGHNVNGVTIGHLALGEYVFSKKQNDYQNEDWIQLMYSDVVTRFPVTSLISRRTFIFARAGFGKSNLNKLLFSELYKQQPTISSRRKEIPVGTIIFDPDGEYFWPDNKGRPGLCDVPELQDNLVVFTDREAPSDFYQSFVASGIKLDIRSMKAKDILSVALSAHKQEQQNVRKLKDLDNGEWVELINLIEETGNASPLEDISGLLQLEKRQDIEAIAARSNMTNIVQLLHEKESKFMDMLSFSLAHGKLCVVDISLLHDSDALILTGLILRSIFNKSQAEFTKRYSASTPVIAVIEEAQSVLTGNSSATAPHRDWVKEGRKYDLGSVLVTQQPGSIPKEILSQGDNWFVLHLLSAMDLLNLQKANAYFSRDILSMLLNEPIPGHGSFWSSVSGKPYPIPMRVLSFEDKYALLDPDYDRPAVDTFAQSLSEMFYPSYAENSLAISRMPGSGLSGLFSGSGVQHHLQE